MRLDVVAKEAIREFVRHINQDRGTTIILTTHDLADVERLCRRIILIDKGTIIYDGGVERIKEQYGTHRTLVLTLTEPHPNPVLEDAEIESNDRGLVRTKIEALNQNGQVVMSMVAMNLFRCRNPN